jgi:hypothetical protein
MGTELFIDYRAAVSGFSQAPIEISLPRSDCIILECTKFVPAIIPDDYDPRAASESKPEGPDEPQKKKRKVKTEVKAEVEQPDAVKIEASNGMKAEPTTNGHHTATLVPSIQRRDTYRPAPPLPSVPQAQPTMPRSILDQPGQRGPSLTHPFAAPARPASSPSSAYMPQSSWRPAVPTRPRPAPAMMNGHASGPMPNGRDWREGMIERTRDIEGF